MANAAFLYTPDFVSYKFNETHPLQQRRLVLIHDLLTAYGHFERGESDLVTPTPATYDDVVSVHGADFADAVRDASQGHPPRDAHRYGLGTGDNPIFNGMWEASLLYMGATLMAADFIANGVYRAAFNSSGGLHHAMYARAAGFCTFNDCALAARRLIGAGMRVAHIDIDAHHGDGTQALLYDEPRALTISLHESGRYLFPGTGFTDEIGKGDGIGYAVNVPLHPGGTDEHYAAAFDRLVDPLIAAYCPDAIILEVGSDAHWQDPLTHLALTSRGWLALVERVISYGKPILALGGGGYNVPTVVRQWTMLQAALAGVTLPDEVPAEFAETHKITRLHDTEAPNLDATTRRHCDKIVEASIRSVREAVFPYHELTPLRGGTLRA